MTNFFSRNEFICCLLVVGILVLSLSSTVVEGIGEKGNQKKIKKKTQKKIKKIKEKAQKKIKAAAVGEKQKDVKQKSEKEKRTDKIIQKNAKALLVAAANAVVKKGESEKNEKQGKKEKNAEARLLLKQKKKQNIKAKKLVKNQKKAVKKAKNMRKKVLKKEKKKLKKKITKLQNSKQAAKNRAFAKKQGFENYQQRESFKNIDRRQQDLHTIRPFQTIEPFFEALEYPKPEESDQGDIPDADKDGIEAYGPAESFWSAAVKTKDDEPFYSRYSPNPLPPGISEGFAVREGLAEGDTPKEVAKDAGGAPADGSHFRDNPSNWEPELMAKARAWKHHLQGSK